MKQKLIMKFLLWNFGFIASVVVFIFAFSINFTIGIIGGIYFVIYTLITGWKINEIVEWMIKGDNTA